RNFTVNGKSVTATFSNANTVSVRNAGAARTCDGGHIGTQSLNIMSEYEATLLGGKDKYGNSIYNYPSSARIKIKFSTPITNFKVFHT
ncbi:hypothetical protein, partial [Pseudomonas sp. SIMBA_044]